MNLTSALLTRRVSYASVYQVASVAALCCPACGKPQEDDLQVLQPCKHLTCVYDQEAQQFTFKSDDFKQRLASTKTSLTDELDSKVLVQLGYGDELLALDLTRAGCWSRELFAFNFNAE
jgi:hypothetical protein|tara:strand:- start:416 stop:772 length:357 start_codon:yes stop_codon:yes gene_type:complete